MSLLEEAKTAFCLMEKSGVSDGEGGFTLAWTEGINFFLIEKHETTIEAQVAERNQTASTYTFLFDKSMTFSQNDYLKRLSDGQIFRVTTPSGEDYTPSSSNLNLGMIKAEKGELPS